ncbi:aconitate hydratase AcnA [Zoogloea sp. 1C4]|uniref:aconitate hydratase AcnA n=1 Tax=Zoogloea sp. 1C4 TaxID=2570190 RepID=UPI001291432B|nr:aconitate hydratase AcnA [Zoogloea sp. 1C4]
MSANPFHTLNRFFLAAGRSGRFHSLPALADAGFPRLGRLPVSLRIILESLLRNLDGRRITEADVRRLASWQPRAERTDEIPFVVARIVLQDFTGVPLLCDLAAMRDVARRFGKNPRVVEPRVPVDLVVDHSVQVDHYREGDALDLNMRLEFGRNAERYRFIKWGMQAFDTFRVVPPGIGIVHQVNLEYLARGVIHDDDLYYPDTLVGTDSHTTMINALGVVGWGVGGIEAEAGMLGQPVYILTPDVVGVHLAGRLREGVTATDLVLAVTEMLRKARVVGKFVEFFGDGAASLTLPDRATLANMAPEYGATMGFFPPDEVTAAYLAATGRSDEEVDTFVRYYQAQGLFGMPRTGEIDYSAQLELDLASVVPSVAGPGRPQDRIALPALKNRFAQLLAAPAGEGGYGKPADHGDAAAPLADGTRLTHGDVLIAAITSCTNTSNPGVMLAAGLLAQKAVARGLRVAPHIKTSLAPGSRVVTDYLGKAGLIEPLEALGFRVVAYGCTTCIGNAGPLAPELEGVVTGHDLICASVLSGNRNFEARIHPAIKANFLMSPPLVVAFALAGRVGIDLDTEPLGTGSDGRPVFLRDIWPSQEEVGAAIASATRPETYRRLYADFATGNPLWNAIATSTGHSYGWDTSTYIAEPPFFDDFGMTPAPIPSIRGARALAIFGDSVTTDHISPAGSIKASSPAGRWLQAHGVTPDEFNSYGSRRGHHEVMMRGTFANVRIRNLMLPPDQDGRPVEGGLTLAQPGGALKTIFDAAMDYVAAGTPTVIFAGDEYGTGSSRDWAAKGTRLLGVKAVVAKSFERIHRSNLVGMGVLPLQFAAGSDATSLGIRGDEVFDLSGLEAGIAPRQSVTLKIRRPDGATREIPLLLRIDTPVEVDYYRNGGILPYVLRSLLEN